MQSHCVLVPLSPAMALQQKTSLTSWDWLNLWTFQPRFLPIAMDFSQSSLLDLIMINFPANVSCPYCGPVGSCDQMLVKVNISGSSQKAASTPANLAVHSDRLARTESSHLSTTALPYVLPTVLSQPGNSSIETCSLMHRFIQSHLHLSFPSLAQGTLIPVLRELLWNNLPSLPRRLIRWRAISVHSEKFTISVCPL